MQERHHGVANARQTHEKLMVQNFVPTIGLLVSSFVWQESGRTRDDINWQKSKHDINYY
jgi:hypothetical protein